MPRRDIEVSLDASETLATMDRVSSKADKMFGRFSKGASSVSVLDNAFSRLKNTILGFIGVGAIFREFDRIDSIAKTADALGVSFDRLQRFTLAGSLGGFRNVEDIIARGSEFLDRFRGGEKSAVNIGRSLGLTYASTVEDLISRASAAGVSEVTRVEIFGRGVRGRDLSRLLQPVEISITEQGARSIERFHDAMTILRNRVSGDITALLRPVLDVTSRLMESRGGRIGVYTIGGVALSPILYRSFMRLINFVLPASGQQIQAGVAGAITQRLATLFGGGGAGVIGRFVGYLSSVFSMLGRIGSALAAIVRAGGPYVMVISSVVLLVRGLYRNFRFMQRALQSVSSVLQGTINFVTDSLGSAFRYLGDLFRDLFYYTDGIVHQIVQVTFELFGVDLERRLYESQAARNKAILDRERAKQVTAEIEEYSKFIESVSEITLPELPATLQSVTNAFDKILGVLGGDVFSGFAQKATELQRRVAGLPLDENARERLNTVVDELNKLEETVGSRFGEYMEAIFKSYISGVSGVELVEPPKSMDKIVEEYQSIMDLIDKYSAAFQVSSDKIRFWKSQIYDKYLKAYEESMKNDPVAQYMKMLEESEKQLQEEQQKKYEEGFRRARSIIEAVNPMERFISSLSDAVQSFVDGFINWDVLEQYAVKMWGSIFPSGTTQRRPEALVGQSGLSSLLNPVQKIEVPVMSIRNMLQQIISEGLYVRV